MSFFDSTTNLVAQILNHLQIRVNPIITSYFHEVKEQHHDLEASRLLPAARCRRAAALAAGGDPRGWPGAGGSRPGAAGGALRLPPPPGLHQPARSARRAPQRGWRGKRAPTRRAAASSGCRPPAPPRSRSPVPAGAGRAARPGRSGHRSSASTASAHRAMAGAPGHAPHPGAEIRRVPSGKGAEASFLPGRGRRLRPLPLPAGPAGGARRGRRKERPPGAGNAPAALAPGRPWGMPQSTGGV